MEIDVLPEVRKGIYCALCSKPLSPSRVKLGETGTDLCVYNALPLPGVVVNPFGTWRAKQR